TCSISIDRPTTSQPSATSSSTSCASLNKDRKNSYATSVCSYRRKSSKTISPRTFRRPTDFGHTPFIASTPRPPTGAPTPTDRRCELSGSVSRDDRRALVYFEYE